RLDRRDREEIVDGSGAERQAAASGQLGLLPRLAQHRHRRRRRADAGLRHCAHAGHQFRPGQWLQDRARPRPEAVLEIQPAHRCLRQVDRQENPGKHRPRLHHRHDARDRPAGDPLGRAGTGDGAGQGGRPDGRAPPGRRARLAGLHFRRRRRRTGQALEIPAHVLGNHPGLPRAAPQRRAEPAGRRGRAGRVARPRGPGRADRRRNRSLLPDRPGGGTGPGGQRADRRHAATGRTERRPRRTG
ncbi:conserved hypothetical protein, partial [Ricinus communis]